MVAKGFEAEAEGSDEEAKDDVEAKVPALGDPEGPARLLAVPGEPYNPPALAGPAE